LTPFRTARSLNAKIVSLSEIYSDMSAPASASAPPAAVDFFFSVAGARLRYRDEGRGPAVLLLHGWTLDLEMWNAQVADLRDAFRLIRLDRRGHGLSSGIPSPERDAADLEALCTHLGLIRVALLGMSQGVRSALAFTRAWPERVSALVLDGPPALDSAALPEAPIDRYVMLLRMHGIEAFRREWSRHPLMQLRTADPAPRALLAAMLERYAGNDLQHLAAAEHSSPALTSLERIATPALVINGEFDLPARRQAAQALLAQLPRAELAEVRDAGHLPNLDSPHAYSSLCRAFLSRHIAPHVSA
jgi:3-oxoadipate enol-lactonase